MHYKQYWKRKGCTKAKEKLDVKESRNDKQLCN